LGQAVLDAPAKEDADVVVSELVVADHGPLRAGAGVQSESCVAGAGAILDRHVVADLPTDAVAVVVLGHHAANGDAAAILEEDAAAGVAGEGGVPGAAAV